MMTAAHTDAAARFFLLLNFLSSFSLPCFSSDFHLVFYPLYIWYFICFSAHSFSRTNLPRCKSTPAESEFLPPPRISVPVLNQMKHFIFI